VILAPGEIIRRRHLPRFLKDSDEDVFPTSLAETEKRLIQRVLKEANWNKHEAARRLRVSRSTLYSKIRRYAISHGDLE
jgi:transcriptional regulator of acetoin/glycerol metabolism